MKTELSLNQLLIIDPGKKIINIKFINIKLEKIGKQIIDQKMNELIQIQINNS